MPKQYYLPTSESARLTLVNTLADNLPGPYATKYNIPSGDLTKLENFRRWYQWCADVLGYTRQRSQGYTQFRDALAYGSGGAAGDLTAPVPFALPVTPVTDDDPPQAITPVANGFALVASIVNRIKGSTNYLAADGEALGIEGAVQPTPDPAATKPTLKAVLAAGGKVEVQWKKQRFTGVRIEVDRGNGQWVFLAVDTEPHYVDTYTLAPGTAAVWKYCAIYLNGDEQFGQWSDPVSATIAG